MNLESGWLLGIGLVLVIYLAVRDMERDYYRRKHEIIRKKKKRLEEAKEKDKTEK